ncbi:glycosyltransferase family 2 protein [Flavobacterium sp. 5]|uniref:glycosyltransferase family 2 protein n=1 Tax=Flavobacterium sp. 5 TaxID=2035199 RepID=UPI000C2C3FAB|nr:glycosyltransferase family 2 protein [Flavobacterium sp. 5]PKB17455.1 glycosyltransferase involved in cell wall biosynthesis [Flavobacterium sp. 5]
MNNSLVSVIIPTYNRAHLIGETLDSVLRQTYTNWECIIVDDGSTDTTAEVVGEYVQSDSRFQFHHRPNDRLKGGNDARNYGFELSKGEYVNWFDDDDVMLENFLKTKMLAFRPELEFVISSGYYVDEKLKNKVLMNVYDTDSLFKDYLLWKNEIITNSVLIKKTFLIGKELFLNFIIRGQEGELFSRLFFKIEKESYLIINEPLFLYRQHENAKSANEEKYNEHHVASRTYIAIQNFKRSVELKDSELIVFYYRTLINFFFRSIENSNYSNSKYIIKELCPILRPIKLKLAIEFQVLGNLLLILSRGSYKIEKRWKNCKI